MGMSFVQIFHLGGNVEKVTIDPDYEKIAIKAARILGLEIAGVDLLESDRGALVLEVNSSPGLEGIEKASEVNVAAAVSDRLNELLEKRGENKKSQGKNFQSGEIGDDSQDVIHNLASFQR